MKKILISLFAVMLLCVTVTANDSPVSDVSKNLKLPPYNTYDITESNGMYDITFYYDDYISTVTADKDGIALSYNKISGTTEKNGLPKLSKSDAKGNATVFVNTAANDIISEIDLSTAEVTYNGSFRVVFYRKTRGIIYDANYLLVTVDCDTGEIIGYNRVFDKNMNIARFDDVIPYESVTEKFRQTNGLELRYNKKISGNTVTAYPVYSVNPLTYYNALNGNVLEAQQSITYNNYFDVTSMYEKAQDGEETGAGVLTVTEIQKNLRSMTELGITDEYEITGAKYLKNANGKYLTVLDFVKDNTKLSVTVDAETGVVCEFNREANVLTDILSNEDIRRKVTDHAEKYIGNYMKEMRISNIVYDDISVFIFERMVNGIPFKSNGLCIAADKSGNITNISFLWDDIEFPPLDNIISKDEAYESFCSKCSFQLRYYQHNGEYIPVYALDSLTAGIIDAVTGDALTYDGKVMLPKKYLAYVDLNSHYSRPQVEKMADCDIYVSRGNVALGDPIIQKDYLLLISAYLPGGKPIIENFGELTDGQLEMLYNAFESAGVITQDEIDYEGYVTREKAVYYFIKTLGYGDVADASEIFVTHFEDSHKFDKRLKGYIELARAMGLIHGSGNKFMPDDYLSNGDSLIIVYNYLSGR